MRIPAVEPLSTIPSTAPRRSAGTRPAANGAMTCADVVVRPTTALAATSTARSGARLAVSSAAPVTPNIAMTKVRWGIRSPRGTKKKMPAAYPNCTAVTTSVADAGDTPRSPAIAGLIDWGK